MAKPNSKTKSKPKTIKLAGNSKYQTIAAVIVIIAAAILGYFLFIASHASTPFVSVEAETGTLDSGGIATKITDSTASGGSAVQFGAPPGGGSTGNALCGFKQGTHPSEIMTITMENEPYSNIIGNNGNPYTNNLANSCALATNYVVFGSPSLPNYLAVTSGLNYQSTFATADCDTGPGCNTGNQSVFAQLGANWKSYEEDMTSNCQGGNSGNYADRHNPAVYYTNIVSACQAQDIPQGSASAGSGNNLYNDLNKLNGGKLTAFSFVTPNLFNDGHTPNNVTNPDAYLQKWIPIIVASPDYQSGALAVLVMWDEGVSGSERTVVIGMSAGMGLTSSSGIQDGTSYNDASVTHTIEQITGQSNLGQSATSMNAGFKF